MLELPEWWDRASCAGVEITVFYGDHRNHASVQRASEFCGGCPVAAECLTHALAQPEEHGIWAGTTWQTRQELLAAIKDGWPMAEIVELVTRTIIPLEPRRRPPRGPHECCRKGCCDE